MVQRFNGLIVQRFQSLPVGRQGSRACLSADRVQEFNGLMVQKLTIGVMVLNLPITIGKTFKP